MKKTNVIISLILIASILCSCARLPTVVETSGSSDLESFVNPETGVEYIACSAALMPITAGELYCKFDNDNRYRTIKFEDPLKFICDDTEFTSGVYRASDIPEITVKSFAPVAAHVYKEKNVAIFLGQLNAEKKYLDESYQELIDSYSEGESPIADDSEYIYAIRDAMSGEPEKDGRHREEQPQRRHTLGGHRPLSGLYACALQAGNGPNTPDPRPSRMAQPSDSRRHGLRSQET